MQKVWYSHCAADLQILFHFLNVCEAILMNRICCNMLLQVTKKLCRIFRVSSGQFLRYIILENFRISLSVNGWLPRLRIKSKCVKNRKHTYTVHFRGVFKLFFLFWCSTIWRKGKSSTFMKRNARTRNDAKICGYLNRPDTLLQYFLKLTSLLYYSRHHRVRFQLVQDSSDRNAQHLRACTHL
jgi:hypothetical protein